MILFKYMNAGLGNRDEYYKNISITDLSGRVQTCPLCDHGPNNEIHLLTKCNQLETSRNHIYIDTDTTIREYLNNVPISDIIERAEYQSQHYMNQQPGETVEELKRRMQALEHMIEEFFTKWTQKLQLQA